MTSIEDGVADDHLAQVHTLGTISAVSDSNPTVLFSNNINVNGK